MNVLKPGSHDPVTPFRLADLDAEARVRLEAARAEAERLLADARREVERLLGEAAAARVDARVQGFQEGLKEGRQKGEEEGRTEALARERIALAPEATRAAAFAEALCTACEEASRRAQADADASLVRLALAIARAVVRREVALDAGVLERSISRAATLAASRKDLEIRVHPSDLEAADRFLPALASRLEGLRARLAADPSVAPGGCRIVSDTGAIDADIESQLGEIERALLGDSRP